MDFSKGHERRRVGKERRSSPRIGTLQAFKLDAEVRVGSTKTYSAKVVNLNSQGTLLEFSRHQSPFVRVNEKVSIKLHLGQDVMWFAGVVRHRHAARVGVSFLRSIGGPNHLGLILNRVLRNPERRRRRPQAA